MRPLRFDGTSKSLRDSGKEGVLLLTFTSPPGSVEEEEGVVGSAGLINDISSYLFRYLAGFHIPTHFIDKASPTSMLVMQLHMIPLEVQVHNTAVGPIARRLDLKDGTDLTFPIIEHYFKHADPGRSLVNEFHVYARDIATPDQLRAINRLASKTNVVLRSLFERRDLKLQSLSLEFGVANNRIVIGDEISPRTCRFVWRKRGGSARQSVVPGIHTYRDVYSRLSHAAAQEGNW